MALTSGLIGKGSPSVTTIGYELLDARYSKTAVILENVTEVFKGSLPSLPSIGVPLVGFEYKPDGGIELLKFRPSQYPYLNKAKLTFASVKDATDFSVTVINAITPDGPLALQLAKRLALVTLLDKYCSRGGMFTVNTLWGTKTHCVLTGLDGIAGEAMDGVLFKMSFNQPNYDMTGADESMSDFMQRVTNGAAVG